MKRNSIAREVTTPHETMWGERLVSRGQEPKVVKQPYVVILYKCQDSRVCTSSVEVADGETRSGKEGIDSSDSSDGIVLNE
jgi:hypothetical protein